MTHPQRDNRRTLQNNSRAERRYPNVLALCLCAAGVLSSAATAAAPQKVTVDPAARYQVLEGWGTSLCWFATIVGGWKDPQRKAVADLLFDPAKGLGLNVVRYNIGGGDAPGHKHMRPGGAVEGYRPDPNKPYDWTADANQRWMLHAAIRRGASVVEAFANSPPYWMTVSGCSAGAADGKANNLRGDRVAAYAAYLADVAQHFRTHWGVTFTSLDPFNEPGAWWWTKGKQQEGCRFDLALQQRTLAALAAALRKRGLGRTILSANDAHAIDWAFWNLRDYTPAGRALVGRINTHSYKDTLRAELRELAARHGKAVWMSEFDMGSNAVGHNHEHMTPALELARQIVLDLRKLQPTAWVFWQAVENEQYCIWWKYNYGLLHGDLMHGTEKFHVTKKYHAMAQFTKFIRPGWRMIGIDANDSVAFVKRDGGRLAIVAVNDTDQPRTRTYDLSAFDTVGPAVARHRTARSEDVKPLAGVATAKGRFEAEEPAKSITTYALTGTAYTGPIKINDTDIGPGANRFQFVGTWSFKGRQTHAYTADNHWGWKKGDSYQVRFRGRQLKLYASKSPDHGIAAISTDGGREQRVDFYAPKRIDQALVYASPRLPMGLHVVKVRVTGEKNPRAKNVVIPADRADVVLR